ncbi:hypothetical protein Bca52824_003118 [Brassica carinata]|uniref:Uncharacterized protein n=1 Tax=Brassica carinata TaxID=52824 RepID=A0A8X7WJ63_BRACI|nr:hypothetical protein Bca52824_003118 [Brassica carinata]
MARRRQLDLEADCSRDLLEWRSQFEVTDNGAVRLLHHRVSGAPRLKPWQFWRPQLRSQA